MTKKSDDLHHTDLTRDIVGLAERANGGEMARILLLYATEDIEQDDSIHPLVLTWLTRCLRRIALGESADKVFNLTRPANRPTLKRRDVEITLEYLQLYPKKEKAETARVILEGKWGINRDTIRKICRKNKKEALKELAFRERLREQYMKGYESLRRNRETLRAISLKEV